MDIFAIPFLSTAIAVIFSWALFAIFCSYLLEAWGQIMSDRGRFLKKNLYLQLKDDQNGINWAELIYNQGTVELISQDSKNPTNYISPKLFAETLVEVVGSTHMVQSQINTHSGEARIEGLNSPVLQNFKLATTLLNSSDLTTLLKRALYIAELKGNDSENGSSERIIYQELISYLSNWYNDLTDQITNWYKRKTRHRLFYIGTILALLINADSIQLFSIYLEYPSKSAQIVHYYHENSDRLEALHTEENTVTSPPKMGTDAKTDYLKTVNKLVEDIQIPIGWEYNIFHETEERIPNNLIHKLLGILISGFAASLGAPF